MAASWPREQHSLGSTLCVVQPGVRAHHARSDTCVLKDVSQRRSQHATPLDPGHAPALAVAPRKRLQKCAWSMQWSCWALYGRPWWLSFHDTAMLRRIWSWQWWHACRVAAGVPHGLGTCSMAGSGDISPVNIIAQEAAPWSPAAQPALAVALREQLDEYHTLWESLGGRAPPALGPAPATPDGQTCRDYHPECAQWAAQARCLSL